VPGSETGKKAGGAPGPRPARRRRFARRRLRLLWVVAIVAAVVYLYYKPITTYMQTRRELAARRAEVQALERTHAELRLRLVDSTSADAREREARRLGYVKPGEQLFVVKGIPEWRQAHAARRNSHP
jgi:cell division protein FtsB